MEGNLLNMGEKYRGFFYITRNSLAIYQEGLASPLVLPFEKNTIADFEVINRDEFTKYFTAFLQQNKIVVSPMAIILSEEAFFEKDLINQEKEKKDEQVKTFLDTVPFEHIASIVLPTKTASKLLATNKDFFEALCDIVKKMGFSVPYVIPAQCIDKKITTLDTTLAKYIFNKIPSIRQCSLSFAVEEQRVPVVQTSQPQREEKSKLPLLIIVFILSLLVLGGVLLYISKNP